VRVYTITLDVITPVHIGSGNTITKKDYRVSGRNVEIYDSLKLYSLLGRGYEGFLMGNETLTDYIQKYNVRANSAIKYSIFCGNSRIRKSDEIHEFIKDPYGCPYIPGSSIKGAIRTAMLSFAISQNKRGDFSPYRRDFISKGANDVEETAFGEPINSVFKHIKISDSDPLSTDDLILCKKIDVFKDGNSNNKLNLCRESIKPGTKVKFKLTIDEPFEEKHKEMANPEYIMSAIRNFSIQYKNTYLSKFGSYNNKKYGDDIIYLGGGTGFLTKTINTSLYGNDALSKVSDFLSDKFKKHNHKQDVQLGISPRAMKCTQANNEIVEMGICKIGIELDETI
jgi:CRISPR-associated protein Csm5